VHGFEFPEQELVFCGCGFDAEDDSSLCFKIFVCGRDTLRHFRANIFIKPTLQFSRTENRSRRLIAFSHALEEFLRGGCLDVVDFVFHAHRHVFDERTGLGFGVEVGWAESGAAGGDLPGAGEDGETGSYFCGCEAYVALESDEPFGVVGCGLVPGVVVVVDYPAGLVLYFCVCGDLESLC
jgi:hypothetical protein